MAFNKVNLSGIIRFDAAAQSVSEILDVESVVIRSTAAALFTLRDSSGNDILSVNTSTNKLTEQVFLNRRVDGLVAQALPNGEIFVYLKMRGV